MKYSVGRVNFPDSFNSKLKIIKKAGINMREYSHRQKMNRWVFHQAIKNIIKY